MKMKLRDPLTLAPHVIFANPRFRAKSAKKFFQVSEVISLMSLLKNIYLLGKNMLETYIISFNQSLSVSWF